MIGLKVLFFASAKEALGVSEIDLEITTTPYTTTKLIEILKIKYPVIESLFRITYLVVIYYWS